MLITWLFDSRYKTNFNFTLVANIEILEKTLSPNILSPNPRICYLICNDMWYAFLYSHFNLLLWIYWYVSWIYNYICNQCLSPLNLCVRILLRQGVLDTTLCVKSLLVSCDIREFSVDGSLVVHFKHYIGQSCPLNYSNLHFEIWTITTW